MSIAIYTACKSSESINHLHLHVRISYTYTYPVAMYIYIFYTYTRPLQIFVTYTLHGPKHFSVHTKIICKVTLSLGLLSSQTLLSGVSIKYHLHTQHRSGLHRLGWVVFVVEKEEKVIPARYILHFVWRDSGALEVQSEEYFITSVHSKALQQGGPEPGPQCSKVGSPRALQALILFLAKFCQKTT